MIYAYRMSGVRTVRLLLGDWDLMINIQANSQHSMNRLITEELGKMPGLKKYQFLNVLESNLDMTVPESWGITKLSRLEKIQPKKM